MKSAIKLHEEMLSAKTPGKIIEALFRIAQSDHNEFMHDTVTAERRCKTCQFNKRAKRVLKINDDWRIADGFEQLLKRLRDLREADCTCPRHPRYVGKGKPTSDCVFCHSMWNTGKATSI